MTNRRSVVARWRQVPSLCSHLFDNVPIHRTKAAVLYSWPFLYVLGGRSGHMACRDFWRFNVENEQWEEIFIEDQPLLENHAACWHDRCLYIFGGQFAQHGTMVMWKEGQRRFIPVKKTGGLYNSSNGRAPLNFRGHTLVSYQDFIYLFGGWCDTTGASNQLWKFDPKSAEWTLLQTAKCPAARHSHSAVIYGQSMWIFGGIRTFDVLGDLWKIDFDNTGALVRCEEIKCRYSPGVRYGHSACVVGQKMFVFGGYNNDGLSTDNFWCFDFISRSWHNITPDRRSDDPSPVLWPQASAFHRCVAAEPPRHGPLIDYDDVVTLSTPFQRGAAASSSADSGYASSCRNTDSAGSLGTVPQTSSSSSSTSQHTVGTSQTRSHRSHSVVTGGGRRPSNVHFLQPTAADNHAYSDEEDLGVVQECHPDEEDNCSFVLPGSVVGFYDEDRHHKKRPSTAFSSKPCVIELKPYPSPRQIAPAESLLDQRIPDETPQASTSFASVHQPSTIPKSAKGPDFAVAQRATMIYLVGSSYIDGNSAYPPKYLKLWVCKFGDDSSAETVHTL